VPDRKEGFLYEKFFCTTAAVVRRVSMGYLFLAKNKPFS
jgi:hypothetical protein